MADLENKTIRYSKGAVSVLWKPGKCIHAGFCAAGLPKVFRPNQKPWIDMDGAATDEIIVQVSKCPSGALSIEKNN